MLHSRGCPRHAVQTADTWTPTIKHGDRDTCLILEHTTDGQYKICYAIRVLEDEHPEMVDRAKKRDLSIPVGGTVGEVYINVGVAAVLPNPKRLDPAHRLAEAEAAGLIPAPDEHTIKFYGGLEEARAEVRNQILGRFASDRSMDAYDWDGIAEQWHQVLDSIERRKLTRQERVWDTEVELHLAERRVTNLRASLDHLKERADQT